LQIVTASPTPLVEALIKKHGVRRDGADHPAPPMHLLIYSLLASFWIVGLIVMVEGLRNAPEAYEDEEGFHYIKRKGEARRPLEVALNHHGI
jgi:hypothetical protein